MGRASTYFYDANNSDKQTLHRRIRPSESQFLEQQNRWNSLKKFLLSALKDASGYVTRSWLQGSYKFGTQVRPVRQGGEFDIDLGVYLCWEGSPEDADIGPKDLKALVQDALLEFKQKNDDVIELVDPPKKRCSRIRFSGDFHIDLPAYHLAEEEDVRSLATEEDNWEDSDPKALYLWFVRQFDDYRRDRARRLVRYLKAWAALSFNQSEDSPPSVLLTVLVANAVSELGDALPGSEDEAFQQVISMILDTIADDPYVANPVNKSENLAGGLSEPSWKVFVDRLNDLDEIARQALEAGSEVEACAIWASAFQYLFPFPADEALGKDASALPALRMR